MDRLSPLRSAAIVGVVMVVGSPGCKGGAGDGETPPPRRRVDAVEAASKPRVDLDGFCDERPSTTDAKDFAMPALADGAATRSRERWQWVNVWATWCKPCIEELPLLGGWRAALQQDRVPLEIVFLSVDDTADAVAEFRTEHPDAPESHRIADRDGLAPWLGTLGLGESTALPIHLFVDPEGKLRCVRLGQVGERDYETIAALVREG